MKFKQKWKLIEKRLVTTELHAFGVHISEPFKVELPDVLLHAREHNLLGIVSLRVVPWVGPLYVRAVPFIPLIGLFDVHSWPSGK